MTTKWLKILKNLDYAFQPIIHSHTGKIYAVEALLRNVKEASGLNSINDLFDLAFEDDVLYEVDLVLRRKAIEKFIQIKIENLKLFYNLDNRIIYNSNYSTGNTSKLLEEFNLKKNAICFELSEKGTQIEQDAMTTMIHHYKSNGYYIAIDDFGIGVSGLKLLYFSEAHIIKIDRFFITNIDIDSKKKLFCSSIVDMAHIMGMKVIAEGVERDNEYYTCKDIGIDFIQGFLIQKPTLEVEKINHSYKTVIKLIKKDRREHVKNIVDPQFITYIEPLHINTSLHDLFLYFKNHPQNIFVPIIDDHHHIKGVIYEVDIKQISYSQYGLSLAKNISYRSKFSNFIKPVLSIEETWGIDKTLEMYNMSHENSKGIFVTNANKYTGFIDVNSLLSLSYKRNIEIAQNQNPLTKLPGNSQIEEYLYKSFKNLETKTHIVYFDFNDFKPFNDYYGFRQGDRAILIFSEILQKSLSSNVFIAHIGGDDFFVGIKESNYNDVYKIIAQIQNDFKNSARSLYNKKDQANEYIISFDRLNTKRKFQLLSVSSAIIELNKKTKKGNFDHAIGLAKKASKKTDTPLGVCF